MEADRDMVEPGIYYAVIDADGDVVYTGNGLMAATILLDPGFFFGKGRTEALALVEARYLRTKWLIASQCAASSAVAP